MTGGIASAPLETLKRTNVSKGKLPLEQFTNGQLIEILRSTYDHQLVAMANEELKRRLSKKGK